MSGSPTTAVGTGIAHSVKDFCNHAFNRVGLDYRDYVKSDNPVDMRPGEVPFLLADPTKARRELGWHPKVDFYDLVRIMVDYDMEMVKREG